MKTSDNLQSLNVSTHNRVEKLSETDCIIETNIIHSYPKGGNKFISKHSLENHMRNYHEAKKLNIECTEKEATNELEQEKKKHGQTRKALESLRMEYYGCKNELMNLQEKNLWLKILFKYLKEIVDISKVGRSDKENSEKVNTKQSEVENVQCHECGYILKTQKRTTPITC